MSANPKLQTTYEVTAERSVLITVVIGQAQLGASVLRLDGQELAAGQIADFNVGAGSSLVGKTLLVKSVVSDVSDATNLTSVRYKLTGGQADRTLDLSATVDIDGDAIIYRAWFEFR